MTNLKGYYYVTSLDRSGNESLPTDTLVRNNCPQYVLPNVFTPNDDGKNDYFSPFFSDGSITDFDYSNCPRFVRKVNIPFDVYAFTDSYPADDGVPRYAYERKEGLALVSDHFSMMNIFTSSTRSKELEEQMINIWRTAYAFDPVSYTHLRAHETKANLV